MQANQSSQADSDDEDDDEDDGFEMVSGSLRGAHGGDVSSLPGHAQKLVHALKVGAGGHTYKTWECLRHGSEVHERDVSFLPSHAQKLVHALKLGSRTYTSCCMHFRLGQGAGGAQPYASQE